MFMSNILEQIKENKMKVIIVLIVAIALITFYIISKNNNTSNGDKLYADRQIVFTYEETKGEVKSSLPYVNINGNSVATLNKNLMTTYYETISHEDKYMTYEYYENDKILSLAVKVYNRYIDGDFPEEITFYNIDINRKMVITDNDLKSMFGVDDNTIKDTINGTVKDYYMYEVRKNYISDCDFACYQQNVGEMDNVKYYVKDNSLYAYLSFTTDSDFMYDSNKPFDLFNFKIK